MSDSDVNRREFIGSPLGRGRFGDANSHQSQELQCAPIPLSSTSHWNKPN